MLQEHVLSVKQIQGADSLPQVEDPLPLLTSQESSGSSCLFLIQWTNGEYWLIFTD